MENIFAQLIAHEIYFTGDNGRPGSGIHIGRRQHHTVIADFPHGYLCFAVAIDIFGPENAEVNGVSAPCSGKARYTGG